MFFFLSVLFQNSNLRVFFLLFKASKLYLRHQVNIDVEHKIQSSAEFQVLTQ